MKRLLLTCTDLMAIQFLVPHVKYLSENGFSVELACSDVGGRLEELKAVLDGVAPVHSVRLVRSPFSPGNRKGYGDLKRIVDGSRWDVIWTNEPVMGVMTRFAAKKARKQGAKVVYMVHGFHFYKGAPLRNWLLYYPVEKYCSRLCDMIVTINQEDYERAKTFHASNVEKIPGVGVNLDRFCPNNDVRSEWRKKLRLSDSDVVLLTVGELTHRKNQKIMLDALYLLKNPNCHLLVCGRGVLEASLKMQVQKLRLNDQVHFLGYRRDIPQLCCAADIFVFTSRQEGLPCALMEAMASGMAVVCSDIRGNTDLIDDGFGGFVVPNDAVSVSKAVKALISDKALCESMGRHNMQKVDAFREERALSAVEKIMVWDRTDR